MSTCDLCGEKTPRAETIEQDAENALEHLRVVHPDDYGDGPERWADGGLVLEDDTLTPEDFQ